MSEHWAEIVDGPVSDHEINFVFEFDSIRLRGPQVKLKDLVGEENRCWPADQSAALAGRYATEPVWVAEGEAKQDRKGSDFHPHVAQLLDGTRPDLSRLFSLSDTAARLCNSADLYEEAIPAGRRSKKRLRLTLSQAAHKRLSRNGAPARPLGISLEQLQLYVFATGKSILALRVTIDVEGGPLRAMELLETQIALGRVQELSWSSGEDGPGFRLASLVHCLVKGAAKAAPGIGRVTTYTYARLDGTPSRAAAEALALRLARQYSTDYDVAETITGVEWVRAFSTVRTAVAIEGAATIVSRTGSDDELPAYLAGFKTNSFHRHYLPIALLALHERAFLIDRTARATFAPEAKGAPVIERLQALLADALLFRLSFRFSELSRISMHNELNLAFHKVMSLDRIQEDFRRDVAAIEAFLSARRDDAHERARQSTERRFYWVTVVGAMALAGLTTFTIVKEFADALFELGARASQIAALAGLAVALATLVLGFLRRPPRNPPGHGTSEAHAQGHMVGHAAVESMIHLAGKSAKERIR